MPQQHEGVQPRQRRRRAMAQQARRGVIGEQDVAAIVDAEEVVGEIIERL